MTKRYKNEFIVETYPNSNEYSLEYMARNGEVIMSAHLLAGTFIFRTDLDEPEIRKQIIYKNIKPITKGESRDDQRID